MSSAIDVSSVCGEAAKGHERDIVAVFVRLVTAECSAEEAAADIDKLYPVGSTDAAEEFLWSFWTLLVATVKKVPATSDPDRMQPMVSMIAHLRSLRDDEVEMWGQKTRVWSELPMLGPCMRDAWNMRPMFTGTEAETESIAEWISLNSFAARVFGAKLQSWDNFAIWEMRSGLEEPPRETTSAKDASLATACEWIAHAGEALHEQGRQGRTLDAMEQRALKPGTLFRSDRSGLGDERWRFWRERIGLFGAGAGSGELKERARKMVEKMERLDSS
ncbi:hypothetical protein DCS_07111 [Drechmeria coniospora]|uniref:Uncharacterized protein n=1 Tax=Drechmeria coniospora TaxID=98403 RepID=A0A151GDH3_DRECN|nr:hypothetical protein DCS_07111 [Drechmeria coniospora]KYK55149.1 hypothetical protein DCS_07111 [Drechmeria coniospora]ODA82224.1 hypothetical protein RJ55_00731 [Drechmeria coniospora]